MIARLLAIVVLALCSDANAAERAVELTPHELAVILTLSPLGPPPADTTNRFSTDARAVALGQRLFFDPRLSGDGRIACSTCHDAALGWADGKPVAVGAGVGRRNTPSLWNVAHNRWFFWDGRADSLWSQAAKPIENGIEMNGDRLQVLHLVAGDEHLRRDYEAVFGALPDAQRFPARGGPLASDGERQANWWTLPSDDQSAATAVLANVAKAIAAYVATIQSGPAPFDRFVADLRAGSTSSRAISTGALRGLKIFIGKGHCVLCHGGPALSNFEFHDTRVRAPSTSEGPDLGRLGGIAQLLADELSAAGPYSDDASSSRAQQAYLLSDSAGVLGHFKTPSLRNVALTAPYMHAGQLTTLTAVVEHYSTLADAGVPADPEHVEALIAPLGLDATEIADVVAFLESMTSERPRARN